MIECKVKKLYGDKLALDVDCSFEEGKIYAIIGNNGSGKSTLLNVLAKQVRYDGTVNAPKDVVYMTQSAYNFDFSVRRNVLLFTPKKDAQRVKEAERMMQAIGLDALAKKKANRLSGGEGQKTALVRTLTQDAKILLLDEPTSSMDISSSKIAEELIKEYRARTNCTVFIVTHSVLQAETIADEILFFDGGKILERGKDIIKTPSTPELQLFLATR
ncbi:MAG: ATP-binding cassette domain-containing protein [Clostridia bacterium]|nr:ATP-binding cassette domain-containing protein [Clostridia bacterium]